jgi:sortase (surface protein transpeptidase)
VFDPSDPRGGDAGRDDVADGDRAGSTSRDPVGGPADEKPSSAGGGAAGGGAAGDVTAMVGPGADTRAQRRERQRRADRSVGRTAVRGLGQLLITAGLVVLLFVVYEVWVTNLFGEQKQAEATANLDKLWSQESDTVVDPNPVVTESGGVVVSTAAAPTADPGARTRNYDTTEGAGFAKMYIPSFGADFMFTVVEGTSQRDLYAGPGHYDQTQFPGEKGNFALAGHRVNKGAPFDDLGLLQSCDAIVIETRDDWYVYRVLPMQNEVAGWADTQHAHCDGVSVQTGEYRGVYGQEIVSPSDIQQVYPVPHVNSREVPANAERLITLTTCHPKFSDRQRMIIHGILTASYPKANGFLPPEMQEVG